MHGAKREMRVLAIGIPDIADNGLLLFRDSGLVSVLCRRLTCDLRRMKLGRQLLTRCKSQRSFDRLARLPTFGSSKSLRFELRVTLRRHDNFDNFVHAKLQTCGQKVTEICCVMKA